MRLVRLALAPREAHIATKDAAPMGAGIVVSVAAENGEDIMLRGSAEITFCHEKY